MTKRVKAFAVLLIVLNGVVLLGQLWPEGAPPFARAANIVFLILNLVFVVAYLRGALPGAGNGSG